MKKMTRFEVKPMNEGRFKNDKLTYLYIVPLANGKHLIRLLKPSKDQMNGDENYRNGKWKKTARMIVETKWFEQRQIKWK